MERTKKKLQSLYANEPQRGIDGQLHEIDKVTRIWDEQGQALAELHSNLRPDLSIETGLAYGFTTLPMLDAMERHDYGRHIAIDPTHVSRWHGIVLAAVEELGFSKRFTWFGERSDQVLTRMIAEGKRAQFVFFDGEHYFETVITDFCLADQLLDIGGLLVINDMWMPPMRAVRSYITNNFAHYEVMPEVHSNIFVVKKIGKNARKWDFFVPFDGAGAAPNAKRSLFGRLMGRQ